MRIIFKIRIYGEKGGLEWRQEDPNYLYFTRSMGTQHKKLLEEGQSASERSQRSVTRIPPGHPEGYLEGFANIYSDVYKRLFAQTNNQNYDQSKDCYPTIYDGIEGMEFIETVLESSNNNSKWTPFNFK